MHEMQDRVCPVGPILCRVIVARFAASVELPKSRQYRALSFQETLCSLGSRSFHHINENVMSWAASRIDAPALW
jgi:hypothetical protein